MKTSVVLLSLIVINTLAIISEPLADLVSAINPWLLASIEIILLLVLYLHQQMKDLGDITNIDVSEIELFEFESKDKTQGLP